MLFRMTNDELQIVGVRVAAMKNKIIHYRIKIIKLTIATIRIRKSFDFILEYFLQPIERPFTLGVCVSVTFPLASSFHFECE